MPNLEFSLPFNSNVPTLDALLALQPANGNKVREIYLSGPQALTGSGRVARDLSWDDFAQLVARIHAAGARVNLVMNSTCEGAEWYTNEALSAMHSYLDWAVGELEIEALTVANPLYLKVIRKWFPQVELGASVLSDIDCVERAKVFADAGCDVICPDVNINRDLEMLARIKNETKTELKLMVNEGCLYKCPWRKFHFNAVSHIGRNAAKVGIDLSPEEFVDQCKNIACNMFFGSCNRLEDDDPAVILKSGWIRPEDMKAYAEVATYFKVSGRTCPHAKVMKMAEAYLSETFHGNVLEIIDSSMAMFQTSRGASLDNDTLGQLHFADQVLGCGRRCHECSWCEQVAEEHLKIESRKG